MTKTDLKAMSRKELEKLSKDIDKALTRVTAKELKEAKTAAEKALKAQGFSLADILAGDAPAQPTKKATKKVTKKPAAPKYANPSDKTQTWTGKGRQPVWFKDAITAGKAPEDRGGLRFQTNLQPT